MLGRFFKFIIGALGFSLVLAAFSALAVLATIFIFNRVAERDEVQVPNVINLPSERAWDVLIKSGLNPEISEIYDPQYPAGKIVSQQPLPGRRVKMHRTVQLIKSAGNPEVVVPRIVGKTSREADVLLKEKQLVGGREVKTYNADYPSGQVVGQRPRAGATMIKDQPVDMLISLGPVPVRYRMPNYQGLKESTARQQLVVAGLNLDAIELANVPNASPDAVIDQSPLPGEPVGTDTPVILRVAAAVDSDPRQGYQWLEFELPPSVGPGEVVVLVDDALGEREILRASRPRDGMLEVVFSPLGDAQVWVFQDGILVAQKFVAAPE